MFQLDWMTAAGIRCMLRVGNEEQARGYYEAIESVRGGSTPWVALTVDTQNGYRVLGSRDGAGAPFRYRMTEYASVQATGDGRALACCACGWVDDIHELEVDAAAEAEDHNFLVHSVRTGTLAESIAMLARSFADRKAAGRPVGSI